MNARRIDPNKPLGATRREIIYVSLGVFAVIGVYGLAARQSIRAAPKVNVPIVGEWLATGKPWRLVFRQDRTLDMSFDVDSEPGKLVVGSYQLDSTGWVKLKLENGRGFTTNLKTQTPSRFDLIDAETEGVTTFERAQ
ncbi:hypothetical protein RZS28_17800 [Methylocapsa polymorpha]|uniref:Uncharacterized protein n=1 Tax=Methylocapsa polymorpha TaxID=3080828 RepID=A0ABZ0HSI8_9HYPH|nr:hypothetical protein RZS28_17800 [Methylocapsa sp. RX1]